MSAAETMPSAPLTALSLNDLDGYQFPPIDWIVDAVLPSGALVLLVGRPKAGKSLLTLDLAASVALGEPFLDKATEQGPVLVVPAEDALRLVRDRLWTRLDTEREAPLYVVPADGSLDQSLRLDEPGSFARLAATVERYRPRLLVLDPLREFHHKRENESDDMAALLRPLRQLAHERDVLIILTHHRNKSATDAARATRGSSAIAGGVDAIITLELADESDEAELTPEQTLTLRVEGRYGPRQRLAARLRSGLRWEPVDPLHMDDLPARQRLIRHLEVTGERLTANELHEVLGGAKTLIQDALRQLLKNEKVTRDGAGTKASPFRYRAAGYQATYDGQNTGTYAARTNNSRASTEKTAHSYGSENPYVTDSVRTRPDHQQAHNEDAVSAFMFCAECQSPLTTGAEIAGQLCRRHLAERYAS